MDFSCYFSLVSLFRPSIFPASVLESILADSEVRETVLLDGLAWPLPLLLKRVLPILQRGLGHRVKLMVTKPFATPEVHDGYAAVKLCRGLGTRLILMISESRCCSSVYVTCRLSL